MLPQHFAFGQTFGTSGQYILLADLFQKRIFGQHGGDSKRTQDAGGDRHGDMPQVVHHFGTHGERGPVAGGQAAQRKPLQLAAKHHQQSHAQHKTGNRITDQHHQTGQGVKPGTGTNRFGNAQRNRHQVAQEKRPQTQTDGDRQFFFHQLPNILGVEKTLAQIEAGKLPQHLHKTLQRRFVKAIQRFDFGDALGIHALPAPVACAADRCALAARVPALQLRHHLLHRPAGHELNHHKGQQQNAEQGGDHQQQAFNDIAQHLICLPRGWRCCPTRSR